MKRAISQPFPRAILYTLFFAGVMLALDIIFKEGGALWERFFIEADTMDYFCEESSRGALFRHKVNTYTNLAYLLGALWILFTGLEDRRKGGKTYLRRHPEWSMVMGIACLIVFVGSTLFHAGLTRWTEWADLAGVYAVALSISFMTMHRIQGLILRRHTPSLPFIVGWFIVWLAACASIFSIKSWYLVLGAFSLIALGGLMVLLFTSRNRSGWYFGLSMGLTVVAVMFFAFDISRIGCDPKSWIQPHGNWHLAVAASFMMYYLFLRKSTASHTAM